MLAKYIRIEDKGLWTISGPWGLHPDLTEERLRFVASTIDKVWREALPAHQPDLGDAAWGLGCRVYERICFAISSGADDKEWLKVIDPTMQFIFSLGQVPVRFYHGEAEHPHNRTLRRTHHELRHIQEAFAFSLPKEKDLLWRIAVETDQDGGVIRVVLVRTDQAGNPNYKWDIPLTDTIAAIAPVTPIQKPGVELPPPEVDLAGQSSLAAADGDDGD